MSRTLSRGGAGALAAALALVLIAGPASAHEVRKVGAYQFTVGWEHEPTYVGIENAVQIFIHDAKGNAIDDIGSPATLQVVAITGTKTSSPLDLEPSFDPDTGLGMHGEFDAPLTPTAPGVYTFHFTGTLNGQAIDEKFTSSDSTFDTVKTPDDIEFPAKVPSNGDLGTSVDRLNPRVAAAAALAKSAKDKGSSATTLALVGLIVAVVLGGAGVVLGLGARRRKA